MHTIFERLAKCGLELLNEFLLNPDAYKKRLYPQSPNSTTNNSTVKRRLKPIDSALKKRDLSRLSSKELYNFIRAREDLILTLIWRMKQVDYISGE